MYTTHCYLSTCGPRNGPQKPVWPFAMKRPETLTLDPVLSWFNSFHSLTTCCCVAIFIIYLRSIPRSPSLSFFFVFFALGHVFFRIFCFLCWDK
jgi:hypothetical protein